MSFQLTGVHLEITETIREYVEKKIGKALKNVDDLISVSVTLSVEKLLQKTEVNLELAGKKLHVEAAENDLYAAIDAASDKLNRVLVKHKEMNTNHRTTPSGRETVERVEREVE